MTRQAFVRVLLSLLLLISQQMASSHVMSHLVGNVDASASASAQPADNHELAKAFAQHQTCNQCLAFAQLAGPLASTPPALALPGQASFRIAARATQGGAAAAILAFQSRAPPLA